MVPAVGVAALGLEGPALGLLAGDAAVLHGVPAAAHDAVVAFEALRELPLTVPELTLRDVVLEDIPAVGVGVVHSARPLHYCNSNCECPSFRAHVPSIRSMWLAGACRSHVVQSPVD